jgi:hypothetical protein
MKSSPRHKFLMNSESSCYVRDTELHRKMGKTKIFDAKEPKAKFKKSNRISEFNFQRSLRKNDFHIRGKIAGSRLLMKNKSTTKLLTDTSSRVTNLMTLRTFSPSLEKI